jgi:hypothetical protein
LKIQQLLTTLNMIVSYNLASVEKNSHHGERGSASHHGV